MNTPEMIPVNSLARHIEPFAGRLSAIAATVVGSGYYVLGPNVTAFEASFATWCGSQAAIGVANGTDALELALKALGIAEGDRVCVVANAAMYGTSAILACNATPVFVDIDPATHNMSASSLQHALEEGSIDAVIITHLYGRLADMGNIVPLCKKHGVRILEDCAQAHGATDASGTRAGNFGDIAAFSFYPTKNLGALGDGGAITSSNPELIQRCRQLRQYGWSAKYTNSLPGGRNSRLDELQAAFLGSLLPEVDGWNARRRAIANRYSSEIRTPALQVPPESGAEYVAHLYVVQSEQREATRDALAAQGVQTEIHYPTPDYLQPCLQVKIAATSLPATEAAARTVLTLPCFPEMTDAEVDTVISSRNRL